MSFISTFTDPIKKLSTAATEWINNSSRKNVYQFNEGTKEDFYLLGKKGANLCEMTRLGLPIPSGFVITTEACNQYFKFLSQEKADFSAIETKANISILPLYLIDEYTRAVHALEYETSRCFGSPHKRDTHFTLPTSRMDTSMPLLLAVRSGASVSMPGMMDTVLNVGINDEIIAQIARSTQNTRFALDLHRRFLQSFGTVVLGVENSVYATILQQFGDKKGFGFSGEFNESDLTTIIFAFKEVVDIPSDPWTQLSMAIAATFTSWFNQRAVSFRDMNGISNELGTAITVQSMVYGCLNNKSASGVCFSRHPSTGERGFWGEFLLKAEGEDLMHGERCPIDLQCLRNLTTDGHSAAYDKLFLIQKQLESHYRDMQDIEFTVENGELYILQTRTGFRTPQAAVRIAVTFAEEHVITEREALLRMDASQMEYFLHPTIDASIGATGLAGLQQLVIGKGISASFGSATGAIVFSNEDAVLWSSAGRAVILCRENICTDDINGFKASDGIITMHGGWTSHGAVIARSLGKPTVTGVAACHMLIDSTLGTLTSPNGSIFLKGEIVTIDGNKGDIYRGRLPTIPAGQDIYYQKMLTWANSYKRLLVLAEVDSQDGVREAIGNGVDGVGIFHTENLFFKPPAFQQFQNYLLSKSMEDRNKILVQIQTFHEQDLLRLFRVTRTRRIAIELLDSSLSKFLPSPSVGNKKYDYEVNELARTDTAACDKTIRSLQLSNPLIGSIGCPVGIIYPEIISMQVESILGAVSLAREEGIDVHPEILIPLVFSDYEVGCIKSTIECGASNFEMKTGLKLETRIGCTIKTPLMCLRTDNILKHTGVNSVTFDCDNLTQLTYGMSKASSTNLMQSYVEKHIFSENPFQSFDSRGTGCLLQLAIENLRKIDQRTKIGVSGYIAGNPKSIAYFDSLGVDFVSCLPRQVPAAQIAAAQSNIRFVLQKEIEDELDVPSILFSVV